MNYYKIITCCPKDIKYISCERLPDVLAILLNKGFDLDSVSEIKRLKTIPKGVEPLTLYPRKMVGITDLVNNSFTEIVLERHSYKLQELLLKKGFDIMESIDAARWVIDAKEGEEFLGTDFNLIISKIMPF